MSSDRWKLHLSVAALIVTAMILALTPAVADPLPTTDEYPEVAFLARNDVPFDAQTAASMAAQLGAPMFITNPDVLSDAARNGIEALNAQVIIVAGGTAAISEEVAEQAAAACNPDCTVHRYGGTGRDETAAELASIADTYGFDRPVLQGSGQVVGDVNVGGTVNADAITVQDAALVSGLNADRLDGNDSSAFLPSSGETKYQIRDWDPTETGNLNIDQGWGFFRITPGSRTNGIVSVDPDLPKQLFGVVMAVSEFELCYVTESGSEILFVELIVAAEDGDDLGTIVAKRSDLTKRTDDACRTYSLSSPVALTDARYVSVIVNVDVGSGTVHLTKGVMTLVPA